MPSRPTLQKLKRDIKKAGGDQYIFDLLASGKAIGAIMEQFGVGRTMYYRWLDADRSGKRRALMHEAKKYKAEAHAEMALRVLEDGLEDDDISSAHVTLRNQVSNYHMAMAAVNDRETFGKKENNVEVNVNFGDLALDALRRRRVTLKAEDVPEAEFEVVEAQKALAEGE